MQIYFIIIVLKMEFYQLRLKEEEKIKELSEYSKRKEEISVNLRSKNYFWK